MRIAAADTWRVQFALSEPYTIASQSYDRTECLFLRLVTDDGTIGSGCAAPAPEVTGETASDSATALGAVAAELRGADATAGNVLPAPCEALLKGCPAAAAAVDMALYDLAAKAAGLPLHRLLGSVGGEVLTSVTIGILPRDETLDRGRDWVARGFGALKVKGGIDVQDDIERLLALRGTVGPEIELRFDANQGYSLEQALQLYLGTTGCDLAVVEQPTAAGDHEATAALARLVTEISRRNNRPAPLLLADESLLGVRDAVELASSGAVGGFNIKLMKSGGIAHARTIAAIARAFQLPLMVSCMDEPALGIAAGLHFALATPGVAWVDLDGHFDLIDDPTSDAVVLRRGRLRTNGRVGIGVDLSS